MVLEDSNKNTSSRNSSGMPRSARGGVGVVGNYNESPANRMNNNMHMRNHVSMNAAPPMRTRLHLPTSIPPSPPFHPNHTIHTNPQTHAPFVPNLHKNTNTNTNTNMNISAPPGSSINSHESFEQNMFHHTDPSLCSSPYLQSTKSAVDAALAIENDRIKSIEALEQNNYTTVEEYKAALKKERRYSKNLVGELAALKSVAVTSTLEAEIHEEGRINCLMRRLDGLQKEKGRIIVELEREEEMLTNTLQKKLNEVRREKAELERQIEKEHLLKARLESRQPNDNSMAH